MTAKISELETDLIQLMNTVINLEEEMIELRKVVDDKFNPYSKTRVKTPSYDGKKVTNITINA